MSRLPQQIIVFSVMCNNPLLGFFWCHSGCNSPHLPGDVAARGSVSCPETLEHLTGQGIWRLSLIKVKWKVQDIKFLWSTYIYFLFSWNSPARKVSCCSFFSSFFSSVTEKWHHLRWNCCRLWVITGKTISWHLGWKHLLQAVVAVWFIFAVNQCSCQARLSDSKIPSVWCFVTWMLGSCLEAAERVVSQPSSLHCSGICQLSQSTKIAFIHSWLSCSCVATSRLLLFSWFFLLKCAVLKMNKSWETMLPADEQSSSQMQPRELVFLLLLFFVWAHAIMWWSSPCSASLFVYTSMHWNVFLPLLAICLAHPWVLKHLSNL